MRDITRLLSAYEQGDAQASEDLLPLLYGELHRMAAELMAREHPGQTLQATALVNEAYLRLMVPTQTQHWNGRGHFYAAAAEAMRRILVERARRRHAVKHGGNRHRIPLDSGLVVDRQHDSHRADDILAVDEALERFAAEDPIKAELVKLRYFVGLTVEEAASILGISRATAQRYWSYARVWLYAELTSRRFGGEGPGSTAPHSKCAKSSGGHRPRFR
jgi:RNA polymerase sigma factor (TIGR02999 family)